MHSTILEMVRIRQDLPIVVNSGRGHEEVVFPRRIDQFVQVNHFSAAVAISTPDKGYLLEGHIAERREIGVTNNLIPIVNTQSYADVAIPVSYDTAHSTSAERSEIDHALAIMQEGVNALVVGFDCGIAGDVVVAVNGHAVTGMATQYTQVSHSLAARRGDRPLDERVGRQDSRPGLGRAGYKPSVVDRIRLCI